MKYSKIPECKIGSNVVQNDIVLTYDGQKVIWFEKTAEGYFVIRIKTDESTIVIDTHRRNETQVFKRVFGPGEWKKTAEGSYVFKCDGEELFEAKINSNQTAMEFMAFRGGFCNNFNPQAVEQMMNESNVQFINCKFTNVAINLFSNGHCIVGRPRIDNLS